MPDTLTWNLTPGDCRSVLATLADHSVDAVVTDPPYELGFMGKAWDKTGIAYDRSVWAEVLRVCKPGAYLLAFGGTRTYHRMACAIEDAGFEVRDSIHWIYGTGFPKSLNLGEGRGTALKPGHEPIVLARKPCEGTTTANVAEWGTGALNVDACRIAGTPEPTRFDPAKHGHEGWRMDATGAEVAANASPLGRWPANVVFDEDAAQELDQLTGERKSGAAVSGDEPSTPTTNVYGKYDRKPFTPHTDSGGASRFFYCSKASRAERDRGCEALPLATAGEATGGRADGSAGLNSPRAGAGRTSGARNVHPTVKPLALMRWLVRLVTPPGGLVLDPFCGSGSTGIAAMQEDVGFLGIDSAPHAIEIATARMGQCYEDLYGTAV